MKDRKQKEWTLRDFLRIIFRHKLVIFASFATIMIAVNIGLEFRTPVYASRVTILVTGRMQKDVEVLRSLGPGSLIPTQMSLALSRPIVERTVNALKLYERPLDYEARHSPRLKKILLEKSAGKLKRDLENMTSGEKKAFFFDRAIRDLSGKITTYPLGDTSMFAISVVDFNPQSAGIIANVLSRSYVIFDLEQQIAELLLIYGKKNETIRKLEIYIDKLLETLDGRRLSDIEAVGPATVKIITQAGPGSLMPIRPTKSSVLFAGFIISMVLGISLAFIFDFFDQTVKSIDDVESFLNISYLGSIPKSKKSVKPITNSTGVATRYTQLIQSLSNRLYLSMKDQNIKSVQFTDMEGSQETALIAANLAICLSQKSGYRVLIIDANFRSPSLHWQFNIPDFPGLADVVEGKSRFENAILGLGNNLSILPAGNNIGNPMVLLGSNDMSDIMQKAKELFDVIFVNSSDIKQYSDAVILSSCIDSTVLIINEGMIRKHIIKHAIAPFEVKKIKIMGAVLSNHKYVIPEIIYRLT